MAPAHIKTVDDSTLEKTDEALAVVLVHLRKLLRVKNRLYSPILRIPVEIIIRILSVVNRGNYRDWRYIFSTCHLIYKIMRRATEVWWKVNYSCTPRSVRAAHLTFQRSKGNPRELVVNLDPGDYTSDARSFLVYWKDERTFQGSRLHTLEFSGTSSLFAYFSWILEGPLHRLERLKVHVLHQLDDLGYTIPLKTPVALQLPTDMPLTVIDLYNATLPWTPNYIAGLRELYLQFEYCYEFAPMPEDNLLGILDASPGWSACRW